MTITHALLIIGIGLVAGTLNTVVGSAAPVSAPRERARLSRRPGREPTPAHSPAEDQVVTLALPHAFLSGTSRLQLSIPLHGPGPRPAPEARP